MPPAANRRLQDLVSVGPAVLRDFELLRIRRLTGQRIDVCCLDTFQAAVAQARDPLLPAEKCQWWYWSRLRKENHAKK